MTQYVSVQVDTQFERMELGDTNPSWGCAWGDYDNDGYPDLIVAEGAFDGPPTTCSLYHNNRDGTLTKVGPADVGELVGLVQQWNYPAWADYDNDGHLDLIVTGSHNIPTPGGNAALWRDLGNGRFGETTGAGSFVADWLWAVPIWGDFNRDGFVDLAAANAWNEPPYVARNLLYFNRGDGTFRSETQGDPWKDLVNTEGGAASDLDGDGDLDVLIAPHQGLRLYENDGTGGFRRIKHWTINGSALAPVCGDYDNDGRMDAFIAVCLGQSSFLLHNEGDGQWKQIPWGLGDEPGGGIWADYDNDADLDLFFCRGQNNTVINQFFINNGDGTFTPLTVGSLVTEPGRRVGGAMADFDNNGFPDLFVSSHGGFPEVLYRNHGNGNHWVAFRLVGTRSNRAAIGAKVRVEANVSGQNLWQLREVGGGNRHQDDLRTHFGLRDAVRATQVRIEWPSGAVQTLHDVAAD